MICVLKLLIHARPNVNLGLCTLSHHPPRDQDSNNIHMTPFSLTKINSSE